ncbi:hypothetical protein NFI96_008955 [Prochilodus magdalenae]|nr:hypothetical protein NFI96_008955 [Prochilodus magdalenae]
MEVGKQSGTQVAGATMMSSFLSTACGKLLQKLMSVQQMLMRLGTERLRLGQLPVIKTNSRFFAGVLLIVKHATSVFSDTPYQGQKYYNFLTVSTALRNKKLKQQNKAYNVSIHTCTCTAHLGGSDRAHAVASFHLLAIPSQATSRKSECNQEHLGARLEDYMSRFPKVRIVRTKKREGLIRTRLLGASVAKGEVLTFLDSHCEANVNWLPPLLDQIAHNPRTIVCPMIDVIDHNHFGYEAQAGDAMRGAFDWEMYYKRIPIPPELQGPDPSNPYESLELNLDTLHCLIKKKYYSEFQLFPLSPVMAGGLFAVKRQWFWELGGYDTGLEIWGGEQYEISFKL